MGPVAAGHDIVSVYGAEGAYQFVMWIDGVLQSSINPKERDFDSTWGGNDPTRFDEVWAAVTPSATEDDPLQGFVVSQSLFAAMETITGVSLTEETLTETQFVLGTVARMIPATASAYSRRLRDAGWNARALT
ncbi:DUF6461 domain-containing protein [Rhodococcus sp. G-MC3]|uniref:DUF6461 domain-containing protein n=1 Tax=Rhodococcus sp. G-MC3 TaxID=3046209 RepID=UPI0024BA012E|nr:DUF6461 domain-containing protein [Rhodococcus sp. G-MC3]MDJ0396734.1 DUF6461 domain-containing protein [Rhodococcus sp. G-MC3]